MVQTQCEINGLCGLRERLVSDAAAVELAKMICADKYGPSWWDYALRSSAGRLHYIKRARRYLAALTAQPGTGSSNGPASEQKTPPIPNEPKD